MSSGTYSGVSVALSGSGYKFPAHVGAIKAIEDAGLNIVELAGTSGGAIVASLYATGTDSDTLKDLSLNHDWSNMMSLSIWSLFRGKGLCSGKSVEDWMVKHTGSQTFGDCSMDLTLISSDIINNSPFIMSKHSTPGLKIGMAARASSSIPVIYQPAKIVGLSLVDGAVVNNIPVDMLMHKGTKKIGIQLTSDKSHASGPVGGFLDIATKSIGLMMDSLDNEHISEASIRDAQIVFVESGYASPLDRNMKLSIRKKLYDAGYNSTKKALASEQ